MQGAPPPPPLITVDRPHCGFYWEGGGVIASEVPLYTVIVSPELSCMDPPESLSILPVWQGFFFKL